MIKNVKHVELQLKYANFKDSLIEQKCSCCNKKYQQKFYGKLKELFFNTYK